ncbi:glycosyltransferase family 2 protein [Bacillus sp. V59.32b]|uniref:teichuronic acid biosynthesis protein TuaG n=1 Tax=Bacillus sp. V59.32b TaxID=1758642 RepID=UPI000E3DD99D|nr:glycosyltransferase family 2 protein [Bacillus sp. V59.32b]RFU67441.1 glycosyltransferase family 2 protein [Bacillus sp. V59.32b]
MDRKQPLVSIITPSYNASEFIERTITSVRKQTFQDWEMIIVDDCSTDDTRDKLRVYAEEDKRIRVIHLKNNGGAAIARNTALQNAEGRYIAFLDSDDCWKRDKLEKQIQFMQNNSYAFTFTGYELIDNDGNPVHKQVEAPRRISYEDMLKNTIVGCLTVMIDRQQTGPVQMPNIRTRQDFATWLSVLKKGFIAYGLNENLAEYRVGNSSISKNKWKAAKMNWFVYRKVEKLNVIKAFWCFSHYAYHAVVKRI